MVLPILTLRSLSRLRSTLADFLIFKCGLCDMDYIGYTTRHLHQPIEEHKSLSSSVGPHMKTKHDLEKPELKAHFTILKKCRSKFDCLVHEMPLIRERQPSLNKQSDSISAKVFV